MAYSALPTWPLILFGILEPVALCVDFRVFWAYEKRLVLTVGSISGYITVLHSPAQYYADQTPNAELSKLVFTSQALSLTLQLGNVLLLLAAVAIICCWTIHPEISRRYLIVVALADLGHIYAAYRGLGDSTFWDPTQWNDMAYGNIGASAFLHINRWLTIAGAFGKLGSLTRDGRKKQ
ncbi:hypothetical protein EDD36DRAFT_421599 [Exophiala viscosa]|uniref:DUF7704 domain-containing protein n=1 Tax=Exophiala viscosa TaxID=2486360 RepID=A0AAN6IAB7_9EURO|nr:hypothetical protein EDD36DRAFT_421599 [Exophiala viscosa]